MKKTKNYVNFKGEYVNVENKTLTEIYNEGKLEGWIMATRKHNEIVKAVDFSRPQGDLSGMTLDEAIKHCDEKAKALSDEGCNECAREHEQLAEWLKELKDYREGSRTCENCKHELKAETEYPCSICRCNHPNNFEWKGGAE